MKKFGKIMTCLLAVVLLVTGLTIGAAAESIYDTASAIQSGKKYSARLYNYEDTADYKITVAKNGTLKLNFDAQISFMYIYVYDADGNPLEVADINLTAYTSDYILSSRSGQTHFSSKWNYTTEHLKGTVTYAVGKGTYYIRFFRGSGSGNGKLSFTATYPSSSSSSKSAKISYLSMTLGKGSSVQLGTVLSGSSSSQKVTWTSSKSSVVSVSSSGKISCKKKGTATITAKLGSSKVKIKIKVK